MIAHALRSDRSGGGRAARQFVDLYCGRNGRRRLRAARFALDRLGFRDGALAVHQPSHFDD